MIKNSGKGNGQDGSCVRNDKADVLALHVVIDVFVWHARRRIVVQDRGACTGTPCRFLQDSSLTLPCVFNLTHFAKFQCKLARVWALHGKRQCFVNAGQPDQLCVLRIDLLGGG